MLILTITCIYTCRICAELSSGLPGNASDQDLHDVRNTLYNEMNLSSAHNSQINSSETPIGHVYEVATSEAIKEGYPYETPVPLGTRNAEHD